MCISQQKAHFYFMVAVRRYLAAIKNVAPGGTRTRVFFFSGSDAMPYTRAHVTSAISSRRRPNTLEL